MKVSQVLIAFLSTTVFLLGQGADAASALTEKGYKLDKVVIFSRHNVRSPLTDKGSAAQTMTTHKWFNWTAPKGQLSFKGGMAEVAMGEYFSAYLQDEGFMPLNWQPAHEEVYFHACADQRTIATAHFFAAGMLPVAEVEIIHNGNINDHDSMIYNGRAPRSPELAAKMAAYAKDTLGTDGTKLYQIVQEDLPVWERIMDYQHSAYLKENKLQHITGEGSFVNCEKGLLKKHGDLFNVMSASDALLMQYYEIPDDMAAAFNQTTNKKDWRHIAHLVETSDLCMVKNPYNAWFLAKNPLNLMLEELQNQERKFTFLCGHDTNVAPILNTLEVEAYSLPGTITQVTPIGGKIVIEKRIKAGVAYADVNFVYASDKQLRNLEVLSLNNAPMSVPLKIKGLQQNSDGLYSYAELEERLREAVHRYDDLQ